METPKLTAITLYTGLYTIEVCHTLALFCKSIIFLQCYEWVVDQNYKNNIGSIHAYGKLYKMNEIYVTMVAGGSR